MGIFHPSTMRDIEDNNNKLSDSEAGGSRHSTDSYSEVIL